MNRTPPPPLNAFSRAVLALHRSPADATLLEYASLLARMGIIRELRIVHVVPDQGPDNAVENQRVLAGVRAEAGRFINSLPGRFPLDFAVLSGSVLDQLLAHAAEQKFDLLLAGHRRNHPLRRSLVRRLATKAPCSVWLVPEGSPPSLQSILAPIDFSERAADALGVASVVASLAGVATITALHVYFDESRTTYEDADAVVRGEEFKTFQHFVAPIDTRGVKIEPIFKEGSHPAHTIVRAAAARSADLIVVATRGRSRSAAILLGSVAEETLVESHSPVLVVKRFGARLGVLGALLDRTFHSAPTVQFD